MNAHISTLTQQDIMQDPLKLMQIYCPVLLDYFENQAICTRWTTISRFSLFGIHNILLFDSYK